MSDANEDKGTAAGTDNTRHSASKKNANRSGGSKAAGGAKAGRRPEDPAEANPDAQSVPKLVLPPIGYYRPLIQGESQESYRIIEKSIMNAIKPRDIVELLLTNDMVRYTWEALRGWKMRTNYTRDLQLAASMGGVAKALVDYSERQVEESGTYGPEAREEKLASAREAIGQMMTGSGEPVEDSPELVEVYNRGTAAGSLPQVYLQALQDLEQLDKMIMVWESRRDHCWREIERRRDEQYERTNRVAYDGLRALGLKDKLIPQVKPASKNRRTSTRKDKSDTGSSALQ